MARREVCYSEPLLVCLCCGGLPVLGFLKGVVVVVPIMLFLTLSFLSTSLLLTPRTFYYAYMTVLETQRIGPNLKFLCAISIWLPLLLWPPLATVAGLFIGFGLGIGYPIYLIFDTDYHVLGGWIAVAKATWQTFTGFWEFNHDELSKECLELKRPYKDTYDVPLYKLPIALLLALAGMIYFGVWGTLLGVLKLLPAILRGWYYYVRGYGMMWRDDACFSFVLIIPFTIGLILWPIAALLGDAVIIAGCWFYGAGTGLKIFSLGFIGALKWLYTSGRDLDAYSNGLIFKHERSCCHSLEEP